MKNCVKQTLNAFGENANVMVVVVKNGIVSVISDDKKRNNINDDIENAINGIVDNLNAIGR